MFLWISGFLKGDDEDDALKYEFTVGHARRIHLIHPDSIWMK